MLEWKWPHLRRTRAGRAQGWHFCCLEESRSVLQHTFVAVVSSYSCQRQKMPLFCEFLSSQLKELHARIIDLKLKSQQSQYLYRKDPFFTCCLFLLLLYFSFSSKTETETSCNKQKPHVWWHCIPQLLLLLCLYDLSRHDFHWNLQPGWTTLGSSHGHSARVCVHTCCIWTLFVSMSI